MLCCSTVCGLWSSWLSKGHLLLFFSQCFASHTLPTTCVCIQGGASHPTQPNGTIVARPLSLFIHQLCLPLRLRGCVGSLDPSPSPLPLSLLPTHRLSAELAWGRCGRLPLGPCVYLCVCVVCPPIALCYRWDLCLSVSASAARRRRKQDARGSTVISQCALSHTIPVQSVYSLHAGPPLDIYMCQQSHRCRPTY